MVHRFEQILIEKTDHGFLRDVEHVKSPASDQSVEKVMAVPRRRLDFIVKQQGMLRDHDVIESALNVIAEHYLFLDRPLAETTTEYLQIIPCVIFRCGDRHFLTLRSAVGSEPRLRSKYSLAVGGHVNSSDFDYPAPHDPPFGSPWFGLFAVAGGLLREIDEELQHSLAVSDIPAPSALLFIDDGVSAMHLGLVFVIHVENESAISIRETDHLTGEWATRERIASIHEGLEAWASLIAAEFVSAREVTP